MQLCNYEIVQIVNFKWKSAWKVVDLEKLYNFGIQKYFIWTP